MDNIYYDGNLKASLTVGNITGSNINSYTKDQVDELLKNKSDINHTHEQYLTEHQDISHLASKEEIPSIKGLATEEYVNNQIDNIDIPEVDLSNCATKEELNEVKQSVSRGKELLASAITDMGVETLATDSFQTMADNINHIESNEFFNIITKNNTDYSYLFYNRTLGNLDLSSWDTKNVIKMNSMFQSCKDTDIIGLENWDTSSVINMSSIFAVTTFKSIDLSNWNFSNVQNINSFFYGSNVESANLTGWDLSNVSDTGYAFEVHNLKYINLTDSNDITVDIVAKQLVKKTEYDPGEIIVPETTSKEIIDYLADKNWIAKKPNGETFEEKYDEDFYVEYRLQPNDYPVNYSYSGLYKANLPSLLLNVMDPSSEVKYSKIEITLNDDTITEDTSVTARDVKSIKLWYPKEVAHLMFIGASEQSPNYIEKLNFINVSNLKSYRLMFANSRCFIAASFSNHFANSSHITDMSRMFYNCRNLGVGELVDKIAFLSLGRMDVSNVKNMSEMFYNCSSMTTINISEWDTRNVTESHDMFYGVRSDISWNYDSSNYKNWSLTEDQTGFSGTFPWNQ